MPMIDVCATIGTFSDKRKLAQDLANAVMRWEDVPPINLFKKNTAAFIHDLPSDAISNAAGDSNYVRVQVLTPVNVLSREKQLGVVQRRLRKSPAVFSYILGRTVYAAPRTGANAEHGSEDSVEMTLVRESAQICDIRQR